MSNELCLIGKQLLTDIANAIRSKTGKTALIYPKDMDTEILSIETGLSPITVNITQSEHQTITVTSKPTLNVINGKITCPDSITVNASVTAEDGYEAGTLNQTSVNAAWGSTVSFSASPATEASQATLSFEIEETSSGPYDIGDTITYKLTSSKIGTGTVEPVEAYCESTDDKWIFSGSDQTTGSYTVTEADILNRSITLTFVNYKTGDTLTELIIDKIGDLAEPNGHLTVTASANEPYTFETGESVNFNVVLINDGNLTITDITLTDEVTGRTWTFDNLNPGVSEEITSDPYIFTSSDIDAGEVVMVFTAEGTSPDPDIPNVDVTNAEVIVSASQDETSAEMSITLSADPTSDIAVGDEITFTGIIRNTGNVSITNGGLSSELVNLSEETFNLAPGEQHSFEYSYTAAQEDIDAGEIIDTVTASASSIRDWDPESVTVSATVTCEEVEASLSVTLSALPTSDVAVGDEVTFTGTVKNTGNVSVTNGSLSSELVDLSEETFNLAPDETYNFEYSYTITQEDVTYGSVTCIVLANASALRGDDPEEVGATAIVTCQSYSLVTVDVTFATDGGSKTYDGTVITAPGYSVTDWPSDTTDTFNIGSVNSYGPEVGIYMNERSYSITYNDNPRKYSYNVIENFGTLDITPAAPTPPTPPTPPTT